MDDIVLIDAFAIFTVLYFVFEARWRYCHALANVYSDRGYLNSSIKKVTSEFDQQEQIGS